MQAAATRQCRLCGGGSFEHLFSNFKRASVRFQKYPLDVSICRDCGLITLDTHEMTQADLDVYYGTYSTYEAAGGLYEGHRALRENQVDWILSHLPAGFTPHRALDVGCGEGFVLELLRQRGLDVFGVDLSPVMIENLAQAYGIHGHAGHVTTAPGLGTYDLVTCITIVEHVLDPSAMIVDLHAACAPDGALYVEVPDSERPLWNMIPDHIAFEHLTHFTERTLGRLLEMHGFDVLAIDHVQNAPDSGNPEAVLRCMARKVSRPPGRYLAINDFERGRAAMLDYHRRHESYLETFRERLEEVVRKTAGAPLAIYCGGEHTATLLARFDVSPLNVVCIYDGDRAIAGRTLAGLPIRHGSEIAKREVRHYLLSTTNHEKEIHAALKANDPECRVYGLYEEFD